MPRKSYFFSVVETLTRLLKEHDEIKQSESVYKKQCRKEIEALDREIAMFEGGEDRNVVMGFWQFVRRVSNHTWAYRLRENFKKKAHPYFLRFLGCDFLK